MDVKENTYATGMPVCWYRPGGGRSGPLPRCVDCTDYYREEPIDRHCFMLDGHRHRRSRHVLQQWSSTAWFTYIESGVSSEIMLILGDREHGPKFGCVDVFDDGNMIGHVNA